MPRAIWRAPLRALVFRMRRALGRFVRGMSLLASALVPRMPPPPPPEPNPIVLVDRDGRTREEE